MNPKISVIVPIYNTEKYLDKCLASILNQTMQEIEVICVDDCSPDDSYLIVERFIEQDSRVSLIRHKENKGLGGARNTGILAAKADFLASVDSDDYIKPEMMKTLWSATENGKFDIVCCGYNSVDENGTKLGSKKFSPEIIDNKNNIIDIYSLMNPAFWNKLWRKSLLTENGIFFPEKLYFQDLATTPRILSQSKSINIIDGSFYNYLVRHDSVTTTYSTKHIRDYFKVFDILLEYMTENNNKDFLNLIDKHLYYHSKNLLATDMSMAEMKDYLSILLQQKDDYLSKNFNIKRTYSDSNFLNSTNKKELISSFKPKSRLPGNMKPKISIIVPVYNTEKYLDKCLASILNQTMKEIEVICVDDCSPDESYLIVERYIEQDSRVSLIRHKENKGLGGARNTGILAAKADFLAGVDSDDSIKPEMMQTLWNASVNGMFDVVCCGYECIDSNEEILPSISFSPPIILNKNDSFDIFSTFNPSFCNKLWKKSLFTKNNIMFPEQLYYEDLATTPRLLSKAAKIITVENRLYLYLIHSDSITRTYSTKHIRDYFKVFDILLGYIIENKLIDNNKDFLVLIDKHLYSHAKNILATDMSMAEMKDYLSILLQQKDDYLSKNFNIKRTYSDSNFINLMSKQKLLSSFAPKSRLPGNMKPKISIIVPIYNTEKYLDKCLTSILNQTMKEIEVICVDDCSPDESYLIIEKYIEQDSRVSLIRHEKSVGSGGARNTGILAAKADFLAGVDSDDSIKPEMMQALWDASDNGMFDVVCCGFDRVDENGNKLDSEIFSPEIIHNGSNTINIYSLMNPAFWNKLWRKTLFIENDIFFPEKVYFQDLATMPRVLSQSKLINIIEGCFYNYLIRRDSVTTTYSSKHVTDHYEVFGILLKDLRINNLLSRYKEEFIEVVDASVYNHAKNVLKSDMDKDYRDKYLHQFLVFKNAFLESNGFSGLEKVEDNLNKIKEKFRINKIKEKFRISSPVATGDLSRVQITFSELFGKVFSPFIKPRQLIKLKNNPESFFKDSNNRFTRVVGVILRII